MIQKMVNLFPEWVAGFTRNQWQVYSGMGGSFEPESAATKRARDRMLKSKDQWAKKILDHQKGFYDKYTKYAIEPW